MLSLCCSAAAQQPTKVSRIGYLDGGFASTNAARINGFRQGLRDLGYIEGKNIIIEYRHSEGKRDRIDELSAELVGLKVDVIVAAYLARINPAQTHVGQHQLEHRGGDTCVI